MIDHGAANHVNDPSVVYVGGTWYMYYTVAQVAEDDRVWLATSPDGVAWTPVGLVVDVGAAGSWESLKVGRPSVFYDDGTFWLWYDGQDGAVRSAGLATSKDGVHFAKHPGNPVLVGAGAVDVARLDATWVLLHEGGDGTYAATSADGVTWCDQGRLIGLSGEAFDAYGQVTPLLYSATGATFDALLYGGASDPCWCKNRIAEVYPSGTAAPPDPDAWCASCVVGSCVDACRDGGYGIEGYCGAPGSADPSACCACVAL